MSLPITDRDTSSLPGAGGSAVHAREHHSTTTASPSAAAQASLIGRREVLTGKAKFGIFGDGKEVAQLAMARAFRKGDWRSGYYRDQTFMFAARHAARSTSSSPSSTPMPTSSTSPGRAAAR